VIRKARPVWRGSRHSGNVDLSSDSGMPANTRYSTRTPFEAEKRTDRNARLV
jgi:osmotically inducible protein OsmC